MKFLQSVLCSSLLTLTAAAQTGTATPQTSPSQTGASPGTAPAQSAPRSTMSPQITPMGGDAVKGPDHPLTMDQMKTLYVAMGYEKTIDQNLESMLTMQKSRAPFIPTTFWDDLDTSFKKIDYSTALYDVYKRYLSVDDATKLIDFSKTEAGKHFLESLPATSREVSQAVQKEQQTVGQEVQARHKDELDAAIKKYRDEHAPKPAPSLGAPTSAPGAAAPAPSSQPAPAPPASSAPHN